MESISWLDSNDITCKSGRYSFKNAHSNSISSLLDVYNSSEDRVAFSVNGAMTEFFNNSTDFMPTKYAFLFQKVSYIEL